MVLIVFEHAPLLLLFPKPPKSRKHCAYVWILKKCRSMGGTIYIYIYRSIHVSIAISISILSYFPILSYQSCLFLSYRILSRLPPTFSYRIPSFAMCYPSSYLSTWLSTYAISSILTTIYVLSFRLVLSISSYPSSLYFLPDLS